MFHRNNFVEDQARAKRLDKTQAQIQVFAVTHLGIAASLPGLVALSQPINAELLLRSY